MGIVSRLPRPRARGTWGPTDDRWYNPGGSFYGGNPLIPDFIGDPESAMRLITVQNCVRVRAFTRMQIPCHIMEVKGRNRTPAKDFYLYEKLHDRPNSWMTASEFWAMAEAHLCLRGNFYAYKFGIEGRPIRELIPLKADVVTGITQGDDFSLTYHIKVKDGTIQPVPREKIFHLRGLTLDGINGVNPIEYARETVGLGNESQRFLSKFFSKGLHPGAVIRHPMSLSAPAHADLRKNLKEKYEGLGKAWEFMLLDENMQIEFPTVKLVDAQYLEHTKMNEAQICGLFRVPLMLIQSGDKAPTYASAEQFMISYSVYGVTPDVVNCEMAINRDLLTPEERKKYYAKFNISSLVRGDFKTRMEGYQIGINSEMMSPNEARELEDMNPYPDGDVYKTRTSTVREPNNKEGDSK